MSLKYSFPSLPLWQDASQDVPSPSLNSFFPHSPLLPIFLAGGGAWPDYQHPISPLGGPSSSSARQARASSYPLPATLVFYPRVPPPREVGLTCIRPSHCACGPSLTAPSFHEVTHTHPAPPPITPLLPRNQMPSCLLDPPPNTR